MDCVQLTESKEKIVMRDLEVAEVRGLTLRFVERACVVVVVGIDGVLE